MIDLNTIDDTSTNFNVSLLVVQLTNLTEVYQNLMALKVIHGLYPSVKINILTSEKHEKIFKKIKWIDDVFTIPTLNSSLSENEKRICIAESILPLTEMKWDFLLNWSFNVSSSYISTLIPAKVKLGYVRRNDLTLKSPDGWSSYIHACNEGNVRQNIHKIDIITTQLLTCFQIHLGQPNKSLQGNVSTKNFFNTSYLSHSFLDAWKTSGKKWTAIDLSSLLKVYSEIDIIHLIRVLLNLDSMVAVVLLGDEKAQSIEKKIFSMLGNKIELINRMDSLVGENTFELNVEVLKRVHWLIAGPGVDSALAGLLGTRVIQSVQINEFYTQGVYGNGHYLVSCPSKNVKIDDLIQVVNFISNKKSLSKNYTYLNYLSENRLSDQSDVYKSKIRATEDGGGLVYEVQSNKGLDIDSWTALVLGQIARSWFCGWTARTGFELNRKLIVPDLMYKLRVLQESIPVMIRIFKQSRSTSEQIYALSSQLKSNYLMCVDTKLEVKALQDKLEELSHLSKKTSEVSSPLIFFEIMKNVLHHHLNGETLNELSKNSIGVYTKLILSLEVLQKWCDYSLGLSRLVSVPSAGLSDSSDSR